MFNKTHVSYNLYLDMYIIVDDFIVAWSRKIIFDVYVPF